LAERLRATNVPFVTYDARTSSEQRETAKQAFQEGAVKLFLGNPAAGGRGLNLQVAEREIFYANYFGLRRRLQAEDRGHRIGTKGSLIITDIVGEGSFDMLILRALRNNMELSDLITGDPTLDWM
jgi:SNF2 family DNA or RNA helicase